MPFLLSGRGDFRPSQGDRGGDGGEGELKQLAQQSNEKAAVTEADESVIGEQGNNVEREAEAEEAELESSATAAAAADATSNSDEQAKPGRYSRVRLSKSGTTLVHQCTDDGLGSKHLTLQFLKAAEDADPDQDKLRTAATGTTAEPAVQATSPHHQRQGFFFLAFIGVMHGKF